MWMAGTGALCAVSSDDASADRGGTGEATGGNCALRRFGFGRSGIFATAANSGDGDEGGRRGDDDGGRDGDAEICLATGGAPISAQGSDGYADVMLEASMVGHAENAREIAAGGAPKTLGQGGTKAGNGAVGTLLSWAWRNEGAGSLGG